MATMNYYAVCNVNGPISVRLEGGTKDEALAAFAAIDARAAIDGCRTDAEDDLGIDGYDLTESEFRRALEDYGAEQVADLSAAVNANSGTVAHIQDGWMLWAVTDLETGERVESGEGEDYDTGRIDSLDLKAGTALVAWDSGVRTPAPLDTLRPER